MRVVICQIEPNFKLFVAWSQYILVIISFGQILWLFEYSYEISTHTSEHDLINHSKEKNMVWKANASNFLV